MRKNTEGGVFDVRKQYGRGVFLLLGENMGVFK